MAVASQRDAGAHGIGHGLVETLRSTQTVRARLAHAVALVLALVTLLSVHMFRQQDKQLQHSFDNDILSIWTRHASTFPVHAKDRYAFGEMGFRTYAYAHALEEMQRQSSFAQLGQEMGGELLKDLQHFEEMQWTLVKPLLVKDRRSIASLAHASTDRKKLLTRQAKAEVSATLHSIVTTFRRASKRGIVTVAERDTLRSTVELVATVRNTLQVDLPIEIYYHGIDNMPELIESAFSTMHAVKTFDLSEMSLFGSDDDKLMDGLLLTNMTTKREAALQALALAASDLDEIIYAAAGVLFLSDPLELFLEPMYKETGTLFFHGLNTGQLADSQRFLNYLRQQYDRGEPSQAIASSPFYNFGLNNQQDPRVLAVDKRRPSVFAALLFNVWLHSPEIRRDIWQAHFPECLTESIWMAFELSKAPYAFEPAYPGAIGTFEGSIEDLPWEPTICPAHALHFVGRDSYASRGGQPLWADGGLKLFPHHPEYLEVKAWSPRGRWQQTNLGQCLIGADARSPTEHNLDGLYAQHRAIDEAYEGIFAPLFAMYNVTIE